MNADPPETPPEQHSAGLLRRTIRRRWLPILTQWGILTTALMIAAYYAFAPVYESTAWLEIDPPGGQPPAPPGQAPPSPRLDIETQLALLTSPGALGMAVHDPKVAALPRFVRSNDPEADLRRLLKVSLQPKTSLILVSADSGSPDEAAVIANAVVDSYLIISEDWIAKETQWQIEQLRRMRNEVEVEQADQRKRIEKLAEMAAEARGGRDDQGAIFAEESRRFREKLTENEVERIRAEAELATLRRRAGEGAKTAEHAEKIEELEARIETLASIEQTLKKRLSYPDNQAKSDAVTLDLKFAEADLRHTHSVLEEINQELGRLNFEARASRGVSVIAKARPSPRPRQNLRPAVMAAIPVAVMAGLLGMFMRIEARSSRGPRPSEDEADTPRRHGEHGEGNGGE